MKKIIAIFAILLLLPSVAFGATFGSGEDYTLDSEATTPGNHYAAGGYVNIDGTVDGDLVAAGGNVYLNNKVTGDATLAGGNIFIHEEIGDDLRVAAGNINIFAPIKGELMAAGGVVKLGSKATVSGDTFIAGGRLVIDAPINGNLRLAGDEVVINSKIAGNVFIEAERITISDTAIIKGDLTYKTREALTLLTSQVEGETNFEFTARPRKDDVKSFIPALAIGLLFVKFLTALVFAFILFGVFKKYTIRTVEETMKKFGMSLLTGLLFTILVPIIFILLLITILGMPFAFILMAYFSIMMILGKVFAGILLGALIWKLFKRQDLVNWWSILVGIILIYIIMLIPLIGWLAVTVLFLASLGVLYYQTVEDLKRLR
jgi:cytoskeletal protein CcmA (bactofilin family)